MKMQFNDAEGRVLHGLLENASNDIVLRLDRAGFVLQTSDNASELGMDFNSLLLMPHISDFAAPGYAELVARRFAEVIGDTTSSAKYGQDAVADPLWRGERWIEFPVLKCGAGDCTNHPAGGPDNDDEDDYRRWYALCLRPIEQEDGPAQGALGLLRAIGNGRFSEDTATTSAVGTVLADPRHRFTMRSFTPSNRATRSDKSVAVFAIDRIQAIVLQHGQCAADEIKWGFSKFIAGAVDDRHELTRIDGERFGVILPGMSARRTKLWAEEVLTTFGELTATSSAEEPRLSASAGIAAFEHDLDTTMRRAELGLVMARAGGGMRAVQCQQGARPLSVHPVPRFQSLPADCTIR